VTQPARLPKQPSQEQRRTRLAAQLLAVLKSSEDFEWACSVLEQGGGGRIILHLNHNNQLTAVGQESARKVS
jgi:hypothetical protein